jgi:hypothetical protein
LGDKITKNEITGYAACMGERRGTTKVLMGKPEEKRPLGRHRHRSEDNIQMDLWNWENQVD